MIKEIREYKALRANGHYALAVRKNNTICTSGQFPIDPVTGKTVEGSFEDKVRQTLSNIEVFIKELGGDKKDIVKVSVILSDLELWERFDKEYGKFFTDNYPARTVMIAKELHFGHLLEIDAIAEIEEE